MKLDQAMDFALQSAHPDPRPSQATARGHPAVSAVERLVARNQCERTLSKRHCVEGKRREGSLDKVEAGVASVGGASDRVGPSGGDNSWSRSDCRCSSPLERLRFGRDLDVSPIAALQLARKTVELGRDPCCSGIAQETYKVSSRRLCLYLPARYSWGLDPCCGGSLDDGRRSVPPPQYLWAFRSLLWWIA